MKHCACLLSLLFSQFTYSQSFEWAKKLGGIESDHGQAITSDVFGNVWTVGYFDGTADFDPGANTSNFFGFGASEVFISKLDASGNYAWAGTMGGNSADEAQAITTDDNGNVYITGYFMGYADLDPGTELLAFTSIGVEDVFITKLDVNGNLLWTKTVGGPSIDIGKSICLDEEGNINVSGYFDETVDFDPGIDTYELTPMYAPSSDVFVLKLDTDGNFIWARNMGGTQPERLSASATDIEGNVYSIGRFLGTSDFDPGTAVNNLVSTPSNSVFISKLDTNGDFVYAKQLGGDGNSYGNSVAIDIDGNVLITGYFTGTIDLNPGSGTSTYTASGTQDGYIVKLNAAGNFMWSKQFGSTSYTQCNSVDTDVVGDVYITGYFTETVDFDPGSGTTNLTSLGGMDGFILKLDDAGNFVNAFHLGGTWEQSSNAISLDQEGNIYSTGFFSNSSDFNPFLATANLSSSNASEDVFVHKMGQCILPAELGVVSGPVEVCYGSEAAYSVAPVNGATSYSWTLPVGWEGSSSSNEMQVNAIALSGEIIVTANNSCGSTTSIPLPIDVFEYLNADVSISVSPSGPFVQGTNVTFTASPINGGSTPSYQWKLNGANVGSNSATYSNSNLQNGDDIACQLTSNAPCIIGGPVLSNSISVNVTASISTVDLGDSILIYPNPATDQIIIEDTGFMIAKIEIYNSQGEKIRCENPLTSKCIIQTHLWTPQIYFYVITKTNGQISRGRFVKI